MKLVPTRQQGTLRANLQKHFLWVKEIKPNLQIYGIGTLISYMFEKINLKD